MNRLYILFTHRNGASIHDATIMLTVFFRFFSGTNFDSARKSRLKTPDEVKLSKGKVTGFHPNQQVVLVIKFHLSVNDLLMCFIKFDQNQRFARSVFCCSSFEVSIFYCKD